MELETSEGIVSESAASKLRSQTTEGVHDSHLVLSDVQKQYQSFVAVKDLSLKVGRGQLLSLLGPSGCGKSTTLRMIAGLVPISSGEILVGGRNLSNVPAYKRDMGLVFQSYALFPHMNVAQNIAYGLSVRGVKGAEAERKVKDALDLVGLSGLDHRRPRELSGGQQQRVALARALVIEPTILLLDEPLSNLDATLRERMRDEIRDIQKRLGITTVFVTHDQSEALAMSDVVAVMNNGRLEQIGTPSEVYDQPQSAFVAGFVGRTNRLRAVPADDGRYAFEGYSLRLPAGGLGACEVLVRPHRVSLSKAGPGESGAALNVVSGIVERVTYVGEIIQTDIRVGSQIVTAEEATQRNASAYEIGTQIVASWRVEDTLSFELQ